MEPADHVSSGATDAAAPGSPADPPVPQVAPEPPPTLPGRGAFILAIVSIAAAAFFGAVIGYGLADLQTQGDSLAAVIGAAVGAAGAAIGVGVVARLALRAYADWHKHPAR